MVQVAPPGVYITMNGADFPAGLAVKDRERQMFVAKGAAQMQPVANTGSRTL